MAVHPFLKQAMRLITIVALCQQVHLNAQKKPTDTSKGGREPAPASRAWFGELSPAYGAVSESTARVFLGANADRFGLDPALSGLTLAVRGETLTGVFFRFQQSYAGVPIYGAEVKVNFNRAGQVVAVNSSYVRNVNLASAFPTVTADQAKAAVDKLIARGPSDDGEAPEDANPKLWIVITKGGPILAWEVVKHSGNSEWKAFVHAKNGSVVDGPRDVNRYASGSGRVFNVNAVVATRDNSLRDQNDAAAAVPASAYSNVILVRLDGNGYLDGLYASSSSSKKRASSPTHQFLFDRSSDGFSETMGYYYIDYAQNYIQSLGFRDVNNRQQVFAVNRLKIDNSFYSPSKKEISYGTGGVDDAEDAEVIWHEYGHSIQDNQVPNFGSSLEAGSMGEGFGDYLAGSLSSQLSGGFQDVCIAEWDATSYSNTNPPCLRRLDSTKHYPESIANEVHADGEIWSATLWQIAGAFGHATADRLVLEHHFLLSPQASFNEAADALITTARSLGWNAGDVRKLRSILQARGFTVSVA